MPLDFSQVNYSGGIRVAPDSVSFLVSASPGEELPLQLSGPGCVSWTDTGTASCGGSYSLVTEADWISFTGAGIGPAFITVSPTNFTYCVGTTQSFSAGNAPGALMYEWTVTGGATLVGTSGSRNENAQVTFTKAGHANVIADAGPLSAGAQGTVVGVTLSPSDGWTTDPGCAVTFTATGTPPGGMYSWSCADAYDQTVSCNFLDIGTNTTTVTYTYNGVACQTTSTGLVQTNAGDWVNIEDDFPDCSGVPYIPIEPQWSRADQCGNKLEIWCQPASEAPFMSYVYKYNGQQIGECVFTCGENEWYYKLTQDGKRYASACMINRNCPYNIDPGCTTTNFLCNDTEYLYYVYTTDCIGGGTVTKPGASPYWLGPWWFPPGPP
jgi:hypothetical protein